MKVSIINQSNNESIALSNEDVTVIGRGVFGIDDKRISKHHGEITVHDNQIRIKSCHKNPIYFKKGTDCKKILDQNNEINLDNNDIFSLVPDEFEFLVRVESEQLPGAFRVREITEINENLEAGAVPVTLSQVMRDIPEESSSAEQPLVSSTSRKRSIEAEDGEQPKKIKTEPEDTSDVASTSTTPNLNADPPPPNNVPVKTDPDSTNPQLPSSSDANVKQEPDSSSVKTEAQVQPAQNVQQNVRPSCDHGIRCFRHNPEHRRDVAHPGDTDYRRPAFPPADVNAPRCPYWEACYRRNPDHFREFLHPPATAYDPNQQPQQQPPPLPQRRVINVNINYGYEEDEDEMEDEDMFNASDDTDVDADYEINGDSPSDDENNLEE